MVKKIFSTKMNYRRERKRARGDDVYRGDIWGGAEDQRDRGDPCDADEYGRSARLDWPELHDFGLGARPSVRTGDELAIFDQIHYRPSSRERAFAHRFLTLASEVSNGHNCRKTDGS